MRNILFFVSAHHSKDDRFFYHQAKALVNEQYNVSIFSFLENKNEVLENINICSREINSLSICKQLKYCQAVLKQKKPFLIICDNPKTVILATRYKMKNKCKVVYDITEWYPSKKNFPVASTNFFAKIVRAIFLILINFVAGLCSDLLIFGEYYKSLPFLLFFWKKRGIIRYYPDLQYINNVKPRFIHDEIRLLYSGKFNIDKGIDKVIEVAKLTALKSKKTVVKLNLIGFFGCEEDKKLIEKLSANLPGNMTIDIRPYLDFKLYCESIVNNDVFLDLRVKDIENNHCLPIKIFYYMASGRPVIYSDLKSIKKEIVTDEIGLFCNPDNVNEIANHICTYIEQQSLYESHCQNSLNASQKLYNWKKEEKIFLDLIKGMIDD